MDRTVPARAQEDGRPVRIIPIDKPLDIPPEFVLPSQSVQDIVKKFDDIAVGRCFCRQRRSLLGHSCDSSASTLNCFTFGKSA